MYRDPRDDRKLTNEERDYITAGGALAAGHSPSEDVKGTMNEALP